MVVDSLQGREGEEDQGTTVTHAAEKEGQRGSNTVHQEALERVVVESAKGVGDIEAVVARVEVLIEIWHVMEETVEEVLPCVEEAHGEEEAGGGLKVKVGNVGHGLDGGLGEDSLESCKGNERRNPHLVFGQRSLIVKDHIRVICNDHNESKGSLETQ